MKLLASYDNTNYISHLLIFFQQDIKHKEVYKSSANIPAKILRYIYTKGYIYSLIPAMRAKISHYGSLYLGKEDDH